MKIPFFSEMTVEEIKRSIVLEYGDVISETAIIIDVETFGKSADTVVFNLAALFFSLDHTKQAEIEEKESDLSLEFRFEPTEQLALGRVMDHETIKWWGSANKQVALKSITELPLSNFKESMQILYDWVRAKKKKYGCRVFYRGMDFDGPILDSLYESAGIKTEWIRGDAARDIRTYIDAKLGLTSGYVPGVPKGDRLITHTAMGDCYNDARAMQVANYLNKSWPALHRDDSKTVVKKHPSSPTISLCNAPPIYNEENSEFFIRPTVFKPTKIKDIDAETNYLSVWVIPNLVNLCVHKKSIFNNASTKVDVSKLKFKSLLVSINDEVMEIDISDNKYIDSIPKEENLYELRMNAYMEVTTPQEGHVVPLVISVESTFNCTNMTMLNKVKVDRVNPSDRVTLLGYMPDVYIFNTDIFDRIDK